MKRLMYGAAFAVTALSAQAALAQSDFAFRGVRGELQMGPAMFHSEGTHNTNVGFGGELGADFNVGDKIVVGAAGTYFLTEQNAENTKYVTGGRVYHKSFSEYGGTIRAGYVVVPNLLLYGTAGYVWNDQRRALIRTTGTSTTTGTGTTAYYKTYTTNGWQAGIGAEYDLNGTFYLDSQIKYSQYYHTARSRAMVGIGVRFK